MNQLRNHLLQLGWSEFFASQLSNPKELEDVVRVVSIRRTQIEVHNGNQALLFSSAQFATEGLRPVVGDWLVLNKNHTAIQGILERTSILQRRFSQGHRANPAAKVHSIVANADGAFIVSSCNEEFNESRIERYLALCYTAGLQTSILLTKADLCENPRTFVRQTRSLMHAGEIHLMNAKSTAEVNPLRKYFKPHKTIALLGSSGVGKSTLVNTLTSELRQRTGEVRQADKRGRHITTERTLLKLPTGGLVIDMPGLRSVGVLPSRAGIDLCFPEMAELARGCRFSNCQHLKEPGCQIHAAIRAAKLTNRRFQNYQKMVNECKN